MENITVDRPKKIIIADGYAVSRIGMATLLSSTQDSSIQIIGVETLGEAEQLAADSSVALILIDRSSLPDAIGIDVLQRLRRGDAALPIAFLSNSSDLRDMWDAFNSGVSGIIPKSSSAALVNSAVMLMMAGGRYLPANALNAMAVYQRERVISERTDWERKPASTEEVTELLGHLTRRQMQVLELMAEGETNQEIAKVCGLSVGTVSRHVCHILRALKAKDRSSEIVRRARAHYR